MPLSDGQLLEKFASGGDQAAFEELVRRHGPMVMGAAKRLLAGMPGADADDAFQATFIVLARRARALRGIESLGGWLHGVAVRVALRARSEAAARGAHERRAAAMSGPGAEPDREASWAALRPVLDEELERLPGKYREPLVLCYLQGRTNEEAAATLGWTKGTVSGQLARAREALRERLERRGVTLAAAALSALLIEKASAAVPGALAAMTVKAAAGNMAAAAAGAGTVSAGAAALTEGVLKTMFWMKVKVVAGIVLAFAVLGAGVPVAVLAVRAGEEAKPAQADGKEAVQAWLKENVKAGELSELVEVADPALKAAFPRHQFFSMRFSMFPVARMTPEPLGAANLFAAGETGKDGKREVTLMKSAADLQGFCAKTLRATNKDAARAAAHGYCLLRKELAQDGFFKFDIKPAEFEVTEKDGNITVKAALTVDGGAAGGLAKMRNSGSIDTLMAFNGKEGTFKLVEESENLRAGMRPICQSLKLNDPDPAVRAAAERDLLIMGRNALPYLHSKIAATSGELQEKIRAFTRRVEAGEGGLNVPGGQPEAN